MFSIFRWNSARKTRCEFVSNGKTLIENGYFHSSLERQPSKIVFDTRERGQKREISIPFTLFEILFHQQIFIISPLSNERRLNIFVYDVFAKYLRSSSMLTARKWVYKSVCLPCCLTEKKKKEKNSLGIFLSFFHYGDF